MRFSLSFLIPAVLIGLLLGSTVALSFPGVDGMLAQHSNQSGIYILEKGEEALLARAWMVENARERIDILTFIWKLDRMGLLATEALLDAAERGVKVRVVVDDLVLEREDLDTLLALTAHPNIAIRIYNPVQSAGLSLLRTLAIFATDFRRFNHRLHNKSFLADGLVGITGGRNVADEYFDYHQEYNFRDRDILLIGPVVASMGANFEAYWTSPQSRPLQELLESKAARLSATAAEQAYGDLHTCAQGLIAELPLVRRVLENKEELLARMLEQMVFSDQIWFVSDRPGKNLGLPGLGGGGEMVEAVRGAIASARTKITIQSPYLVLEKDGLGLYEKLLAGVEVRISTNSLASTDNLSSFAGYMADRQELLDAGFLLREFRPNPAIERELIERYLGPADKAPIFVLHTKTIVIDEILLYIGTFNIDPRSAHLNTEEGVFIRNAQLAQQVERQIEIEMLPENSWNPRIADPNRQAGFWRRLRTGVLRILPIRPLL